MSGEIRCFRRRLFGGFDTRDVVQYIKELASERNKYKSAGDRFESELRQFESEIARLRTRLAEAERRVSEISLHSLDDAADSLATLKDTYVNLRTEMEAISRIIGVELERLDGTLANLSDAFSETDARFSDIQATLEREKTELFPREGTAG